MHIIVQNSLVNAKSELVKTGLIPIERPCGSSQKFKTQNL